MKISAVFNRSRISKLLTALLIGGLIPAFLPTPALASGCTAANTSTVDVYTVLTFTSTTTCNWSVPTGVTSIDVFMVGGGGGGGADGGGGGGGGAAISRSAFAVTAGNTLALTVGTGGAASTFTGFSGDNGTASTLVRNSPSTTLTANGGTKGGLFPSGVAGAGGTAVNGGFAGGLGGTASGTVNRKGGDGFTGVSNYFSGSKIEYGGGGGGGSYYEGSGSFTESLGKSGGGNGGASSAANNRPGNPGRTNSGGGGGGGSANPPQQPGGRGADGVIIIRYATDSANAFPSSLASSLAARYSPGDMQVLDSSRKGWIDSSGTNASVSNANFVGSPTINTRGSTDGANPTNSTKTLLVSKGGTGDRVTLSNLPAGYTLFHVARYVTGGTNRRLITASGGDWLSGFYNGTNGCGHHSVWLTSSGCNTTSLYGWQLSTDQLQYFRQNGKDVTLDRNAADGYGNYINRQSTSTGFGINNDPYSQQSSWEVADVLIFNRQLTAGEIRLVENHLSLVNGLTLSGSFYSSETDTAINFSGGYLRGEYASGMYVNDLFTMQSWVNPGSTCDGGTYCALFSYENVLVTAITGGTFRYALYGSISGWVWIDTGVRLPSSEWHHLSLVKGLVGNQANAIKVYLDGQLAYTNTGSPYRAVAATGSTSDVVYTYDTWWYLGARDASGTFRGSIDEFKLWKVARTESEIAADMHSTDYTSSNLQLYFDFNRDSLSNTLDVPNLAIGGAPRSDLDPRSQTTIYLDVKTVASVGPYTTVTFPRTYLNQFGGWEAPGIQKQASALVVGGGGGGGNGWDNAGGGGGGGGMVLTTTFTLPNSGNMPVKVGTGGVGSPSVRVDSTAFSGTSSTFSSVTALGGGAGLPGRTYIGGIPKTGGAAQVGSISSATGGSGGGSSGGGGGGGGAVANGSLGVLTGGSGGLGLSQNYSGSDLAYGTGGRGANGSTTISGASGSTNIGAGGGGGGGASSASGYGGNGGSGVVVIRWLTASVPTYTKPSNVTINVGMTETFTVNTATDSSTAMLTRTFKWESSTAGAAGPFTVIKQGTGASNAFFSWVPPDTSTSGSSYLFRLTVTDSDTAGLFISDSSTAFAVINLALGMSGNTSIKKTINSSRVETLTVTNGTPTYRYSLSPPISGITLDTSTVGFPRIRLAETLTVGTYLETLTVTDSVSATFNLPLTITVSGAPTLSNSADIVTTGQVFHLDSGNSASYTPGTSASGTTGIRDISGGGHTVTVNGSALAYSDDNGGTLALSTANSNFLQFTKRSTLTRWTIEAFVKIDAVSANGSCLVTNQFVSNLMNYSLCLDAGRTWYSGFHTASGWTYKRAGTPLVTDTWSHIVGTYDASSGANGVQLYLNGSLVTNISDSSVNGGATPPAGGSQTVYVGRLHDATNSFISMTTGAIRIYDSALSLAQVQQNYNATRTRFLSENINQIKLAQKHNTTTVRNFTITSGGDTKTVTFAVGNRTGVEWNTSDTGTVRLTVKPELVVNTYYDTITVTDNFSTSTILPVKITISKGDQAKLSFGQYNAFPGISSYPINVYGGSGGGTVTRSLVDSGTAGCVLTSSMFLTAARVGACSVRAVKATDANWLTETATATIFWIQWSDAYATRAPSTPTEIVLNHSTAITKYNYDTLTVTSYQNSSGVTITSIAASSVIRIIGDGFSPTAAYTEVTFANRDGIDLTSGLQVLTDGSGNNYLQLTLPAGVTTGAITVNSPKGTAVGPTLTITP